MLLNGFRQNYLDKELLDYDVTVLGIAPEAEAWLAIKEAEAAMKKLAVRSIMRAAA